jgi:hypothetical protein
VKTYGSKITFWPIQILTSIIVNNNFYAVYHKYYFLYNFGLWREGGLKMGHLLLSVSSRVMRPTVDEWIHDDTNSIFFRDWKSSRKKKKKITINSKDVQWWKLNKTSSKNAHITTLTTNLKKKLSSTIWRKQKLKFMKKLKKIKFIYWTKVREMKIKYVICFWIFERS